MHALDLTALLLLAGGLGCASAAVTLAFGWRRPRPEETAESAA